MTNACNTACDIKYLTVTVKIIKCHTLLRTKRQIIMYKERRMTKCVHMTYSTVVLVPPISTVDVWCGTDDLMGPLNREIAVREGVTNKIHRCGLVRRWNKCVKPLPVVVKVR